MVVTDENINEAEKLVLNMKDTGIDYVVFKPYVIHPDSINKKKLSLDYDSILEVWSRNTPR